MNRERLIAIVEEVRECQSLAELKALVCDLEASDENRRYVCPEVFGAIKWELPRLRQIPEVVEVPRIEVPRIPRISASSNKKYVLLKTDVAWSTKPQVRALMEILSAHAKVGDVLEESSIVEMMVANEAILQTRQGGKRIWDYYKGAHNEGLRAHGNVEVVK